MTGTRDLAVKVSLKADGSGLVGQVRSAVAAVDKMKEAAQGAAAAGRDMASGTAAAASAIVMNATAGRQAASAASILSAQTQQASAAIVAIANVSGNAPVSLSSYGTAQQQTGLAANGLAADFRVQQQTIDALSAEMADARLEIDRLSAALRGSGKAVNDNAKALEAGARSAGQVKAGYYSMGQQMQDIGIQASMATDVVWDGFRIMAMQGGQLATAIDMIGPKGAAGRMAAFFAGPWGAVVLTATAILGPMIASLWETDKAADAAAESAKRLGDYVDDIGNFFDRTTGKIKETNRQLLIFAAQTAGKREEAARGVLAEANREIRETVYASAKPRTVGTGVYSPGATLGQTQVPGSTALIDIGRSNTDMDRRLFQLATSDDPAAKAAAKVIEQRGRAAQARKDIEKAEAEQRSFLTGQLDASLRTPGPKVRAPKAASTVARDEFGRDAADKVAGIVAQFDAAPGVIDKTNAKVRELDDLIDDLRRRKPPGFEGLIASAEAAKATVRDGLIKTVADAFARPQTLADKAGVAMRDLDSVIADLSSKKPVDWEKSVVAAEAAKGVISDALNAPIAEYLRQSDEQSQVQQLLIAGRSAEAEVLGIILDLERQRGPLTDAQVDAVRQSVAQRRDEAAALERLSRWQSVYLDQVRDTRDAIQDAVQALLRGDIKGLLETPGKLIEAYQQAQGRELFEGLFGDSFAELERALTEGPVDKASRRMASGMDTATAAVAALGKAATGAAVEIATGQSADTDEITVTGSRQPRTDVDSLTRDMLSKVATDIADLFTSPALAKEIGTRIGEAGAIALQGASTGKSIATIADTLGFGKSIDGTGAQIGGALGSIVGGPIGSIVGAIAGGLIGSAFDGPTRSGYSSIGTDANGNATTAISGGRNSEGRQRESLTYADAVLDGLAKIAGGLGGRLGAGLDLGTIGTQGDQYVFDPDGAGSAAGSKFDSLDKAVEAALASAIGKGAVTGLSDAVRKALGSSSDVDKALAEALRVKQLETLLGGVAGQIGAMFDEFDNLASERVRLAKSYGLDLLAVEKKNAEERAALLDDALRSRVGSLQSLLDDMRYGDLFEGDANERRSQILAEIVEARRDVDAGVEGAADRVAELYRLLLDTTRENFGTAGDQLTGDRALVQSGAGDIIKRETDRINAAAQQAKATTDAVVAGNALADEGNDLAATNNTKLSEISAQLAALTAAVQSQTASTERASLMQSVVRNSQLS